MKYLLYPQSKDDHRQSDLRFYNPAFDSGGG
jgi:hypothetical protein